MASHCQDCTACCVVFDVPGVTKFAEPCKHIGCTPNGPGCHIYAERPTECMTYACIWLDSQRRLGQEFREDLRPDICHVVMGYPSARDCETMFVYPLPGHEDAWRLPPVSDYLREILSKGAKLVVIEASGRRWSIKGDMAIRGTEEEFAELLV